MRSILTLVLMLALVASASAQWYGTAPRAFNENNIQLFWDGVGYEVEQSNAGIGGYRETALGADTLFVAFDPSSATYERMEVWIEFIADPHTANVAVKKARNIAVYWLQSLAYSARTVTAGNKLSLPDLNSEGGVTEYAYRTITPDSTSYANKVLIANISGLMGARTGRLGPFFVDANAAADSTCSGFVLVTADTVGVSWQVLVIPRT
jgi:hypothetical protein